MLLGVRFLCRGTEKRIAGPKENEMFEKADEIQDRAEALRKDGTTVTIEAANGRGTVAWSNWIVRHGSEQGEFKFLETAMVFAEDFARPRALKVVVVE